MTGEEAIISALRQRTEWRFLGIFSSGDHVLPTMKSSRTTSRQPPASVSQQSMSHSLKAMGVLNDRKQVSWPGSSCCHAVKFTGGRSCAMSASLQTGSGSRKGREKQRDLWVLPPHTFYNVSSSGVSRKVSRKELQRSCETKGPRGPESGIVGKRLYCEWLRNSGVQPRVQMIGYIPLARSGAIPVTHIKVSQPGYVSNHC